MATRGATVSSLRRLTLRQNFTRVKSYRCMFGILVFVLTQLTTVVRHEIRDDRLRHAPVVLNIVSIIAGRLEFKLVNIEVKL